MTVAGDTTGDITGGITGGTGGGAGGGASAEHVSVRALAPDEARLVPAIWRAAWQGAEAGAAGNRATVGDPGRERPTSQDTGPARLYPLEERVWLDRLASHHDPELLLGAFDGRELVGVGYGRLPTASWLPADVGWVALLAVVGPWQGCGLGTRLFSELAGRLRAAGAKRFRLGSEANHLLPGLPQEAPAAAWRLARRVGARFTTTEHDLLLDLRPTLPPAPLPAGWRVRDDDPDGAIAFVARAFPGRWAHEVASYVAAGATILTLVDERAGEAASRGAGGGPPATKGFCAVFTGEERLVGPQLYWRQALEGPGVRVGGMGPLGLDDAARGGGLGLAIVGAGADWLKGRGLTDAVINWTTLTTFYGKLGARVWRTYQRAEGPL